MPGLIAFALSRKGLVVLALAAALAAGAWLYWSGRADEARDNRLDRAEEALENVETGHAVEDDVRSRPPDARRDELLEWTDD